MRTRDFRIESYMASPSTDQAGDVDLTRWRVIADDADNPGVEIIARQGFHTYDDAVKFVRNQRSSPSSDGG